MHRLSVPSPSSGPHKRLDAAQLFFVTFFPCLNLPWLPLLLHINCEQHVLLRRKRYLLRRPASTHLRPASLRPSPLRATPTPTTILQPPSLRHPTPGLPLVRPPSLRAAPLRASSPRALPVLLRPIPPPLRGTTLQQLFARSLRPTTPNAPTTPPPRLGPRMGT
jgi:hypothetical protein